MEIGGNFCQILELGGTTIKGRRVAQHWEVTAYGSYFWELKKTI